MCRRSILHLEREFSPATARRSKRCAVASLREKILLKISKVLRFQHERCCNRRRRSRAVSTTFNDHRHRKLRLFEWSDAKEPAVDSWILVVHDHFVVLTNDVAFVVLLDFASRL